MQTKGGTLANIKRMRIYLATILVLTLFIKGYSCECPIYHQVRTLDSISYERSDLVIIGSIVKIGTEYKIKIIEILKGESKNEILIGLSDGEDEVFSTCTFYPNRKGVYLLYLNRKIIEGRSIYYSSKCSGTRLLSLEYYPSSLSSKLSKKLVIKETNEWIEKLRKER